MASHPTAEVVRLATVRRFLIARVCRGTAAGLVGATAGWHVFDVTGSVLALGLLGVIQFLPVIPVGLWAGALADTRDRVLLTRLAQLGIMLCAAALAGVAILGGAVEWIFGAILLFACFEALERPANGAILPALVSAEQFGTAVNVVATGRNAAWALGPVLGGLIIAKAGIGAAYAAAAFLVAVSALVLGRVPPALPSGIDEAADAGAGRVSVAAIREGISFVRRTPAVLGAMTLDLFAVVFASVDALLPVFAREVLEVGPTGFGFLSGALAAGTFLMAALMLARPPGPRPGRALLLAVAVFGLSTLIFAASTSLLLSVAALVAAGMADQVSMVARETLLQMSTPDALRGRVNAVNFVFIGASNELGRAESGAVAAWIGAVASVWLGGGLCLVALVAVGFGMPELARFRTPASDPRTDAR